MNAVRSSTVSVVGGSARHRGFDDPNDPSVMVNPLAMQQNRSNPKTIRIAGDGLGGMMKINPMAFGSQYSNSEVGSVVGMGDLADAILI